MKAVMAEAANASTSSRRPPEAIQGTLHHADSVRSQKYTDSHHSFTNSLVPSSQPALAGWRIAAEQASTRFSPPTTPSKQSNVSSSSPRHPPSIPRGPSGPIHTAPGLGPIITPTRNAPSPSAIASSSNIRRAS